MIAGTALTLTVVVSAGAGNVATPPGTDPALSRFYAQKLAWTPCGDGFDCAKAKVPLDYAKPSGQTIKLALKRIRGAATATRTLFFNPGGPGDSGVEHVPLQGLSLSAALGKTYDVVGFDPRGVGASAPIDCLTDAQLDSWFTRPSAPSTASAKKAYLQQIATFGKGCLKRSGAVAAHVSTVEVAKDLDVLRAVVGSPKLDFLGFSYGTKIGSVYAQLFPKRVGRMVLDGAEDPKLNGVEAQRSQLGGYQIAITAYLRDCVAQPDCSLGTTEGEAAQTLRSFVDGLARSPLPTADPQRPLTDSRALFGIIYVMYDPQYRPLLNFGLQLALNGDDGKILGQLSDLYVGRGPSGYPNNGNKFEANQAVECLDSASRAGASVAEKAVPTFRRISPLFGPFFAWSSASCELWPIRAANPRPTIAPVGAPPILVVGTTRDNATPYTQAVALAKALKNATLLTYVGDGHLAYLRNACIDNWVNRYLLTGKLPAKGTRCT